MTDVEVDVWSNKERRLEVNEMTDAEVDVWSNKERRS